MGSQVSKVRSMMKEEEKRTWMNEHRTELKSSYYTIHSPGDYISEPPYRDYPVIEAKGGMTGQIVSSVVQHGLDVKTEELEGLAWVVYVSP